MAGPRADRPHLPGYGIAAGPAGLLPWSWAEERLRASSPRVRPCRSRPEDPYEPVIGLREKDFTGSPTRWTFP
ncbi:hypothetical protein M8542_24585 [Amycolatopsis sp. OK19-0408]|uniref:Uncharacterized protein n=1 Tax=Amycolatopsis iheyensis TaxID=2945988 RepID=A0A9X2SMW8_9PSEU|nr:hypothetical protein [Amycolatopsis iheyensis]MCR6486010.1 hypothetical protein [Amycolatopsis iheyensis]